MFITRTLISLWSSLFVNYPQLNKIKRINNNNWKKSYVGHIKSLGGDIFHLKMTRKTSMIPFGLWNTKLYQKKSYLGHIKSLGGDIFQVKMTRKTSVITWDCETPNMFDWINVHFTISTLTKIGYCTSNSFHIHAAKPSLSLVWFEQIIISILFQYPWNYGPARQLDAFKLIKDMGERNKSKYDYS